MNREETNLNADEKISTNLKKYTSIGHYPKPEKTIVHCGYHKVATTFFIKILTEVAHQFGWNFQNTFQQDEVHPETDIFCDSNSRLKFKNLRPHVGSHMIRDPRDMIISAYFYHLWCSEKWCHQPKAKFGNQSYQSYLNSLPKDEGIQAEIKRIKGIILNMLDWNYSNPNFIEIRLEDLASNETEIFIKFFTKYGFNDEQLDRAIQIVEQLSFDKRAGRKRGEEDRNSHFRKGVSGDWKNHFTAEHKALFKEMYPNVLIKLRYEQDNQW